MEGDGSGAAQGLALALILRKVPLPRNLYSNGVRGLADAKSAEPVDFARKGILHRRQVGPIRSYLIETPMLADYLEEALSQFPEDFEEPL